MVMFWLSPIRKIPTCPLTQCLFPHCHYAIRANNQTGVQIVSSIQTLQKCTYLNSFTESHVICEKCTAIGIVVHFPKPLHTFHLVRISTVLSSTYSVGYSLSFKLSPISNSSTGFSSSSSPFLSLLFSGSSRCEDVRMLVTLCSKPVHVLFKIDKVLCDS